MPESLRSQRGLDRGAEAMVIPQHRTDRNWRTTKSRCRKICKHCQPKGCPWQQDVIVTENSVRVLSLIFCHVQSQPTHMVEPTIGLCMHHRSIFSIILLKISQRQTPWWDSHLFCPSTSVKAPRGRVLGRLEGKQGLTVRFKQGKWMFGWSFSMLFIHPGSLLRGIPLDQPWPTSIKVHSSFWKAKKCTKDSKDRF